MKRYALLILLLLNFAAYGTSEDESNSCELSDLSEEERVSENLAVQLDEQLNGLSESYTRLSDLYGELFQKNMDQEDVITKQKIIIKKYKKQTRLSRFNLFLSM